MTPSSRPGAPADSVAPVPALTAAAPSRRAGAPERPWWKDAVVYQIYPRSFADRDGNGIGDLAGITSRVPYLAALGVDAVGGGQAQAGGPIGHDDAEQARDPGGGLARRTDDGVRSPIYGDLSGLKKVTTFVGTREIFLTDNALFHAKLLEAGGDSTLHVGEGLDHVYPASGAA